ncbi:MAG: hypothetical protein ACREO5_01675 [Candidatus Binatia bacterium]
MNPLQILQLLQAAIAVLTLSLNAPAAQQQQAIAFANQAVLIASEASQVPTTLTLADQVTSSTAPSAPVIPNSTPEIAATSTEATTTQNLGASTPADTTTTTETTPAPIVKTQVGWDQGTKPFGVNGLVSLEAENPKASTTLFEYHANRGIYESATLTINGTDYPMNLTTIGGGQSSVAQLVLDNAAAGLQSGQTWVFTIRIETATHYATKTGQLTIP